MLHYARVQKTTLSMEEAKEGVEIGPVDFDLFKEMAEVGCGVRVEFEIKIWRGGKIGMNDLLMITG